MNQNKQKIVEQIGPQRKIILQHLHYVNIIAILIIIKPIIIKYQLIKNSLYIWHISNFSNLHQCRMTESLAKIPTNLIPY